MPQQYAPWPAAHKHEVRGVAKQTAVSGVGLVGLVSRGGSGS